MNDNDVVIEAWNTVLFDKFSRFKHLIVAGLSGHSGELLSRRLFRAGEGVLDVGYGFGDTTIRIAGEVGPNGQAVGVDCAENFVRASEQDALATGVRNASFFAADVQVDDLRGPYDQAFARFGTMFFMLPGGAMRNIREALKPQVVAALRETLSRYARKDGVWAPSSTWFITARNPAGGQS